MLDRIPTKVLTNGAIRYAVYDEEENFLRYEYILPADEPTQEGTSLNSKNLLSNNTAAMYNFPTSAGEPTPDLAFARLVNASTWHLIQEYTTAGTYIYHIPEGITELGICMIGGGGQGGSLVRISSGSSQYILASGGASGVVKSFILDTSALSSLNIVVGAGGKNGAVNGGTTSVNGITATGGEAGKSSGGAAADIDIIGSSGGQPSFVNWGGQSKGDNIAAGATHQPIVNFPTNQNRLLSFGDALNTPAQSVNPFESDLSSPRKYLLSSGGFAEIYVTSSGSPMGTVVEADPPNPNIPNIKGGDGSFASGNKVQLKGKAATGYGNGGGAAVAFESFQPNTTWSSAEGGDGSDGAVFIYAR